ncbi:MAG: GNAT family N-acetyltransferase [Bacteroidota bacterium]
MLNHYVYREANEADLEQLKQLGFIAFSKHFEQLSEQGRNALETALNDESRYVHLLKHAKCFASTFEDSIIGMAFIIRSGNAFDVFEKDWSVIRMVSVHPQHSGKGIARTLTQHCIQYAKQMNEKTIALHTSEMMPNARHLYESMGFKIKKEIDPRFGKRYWLYVLEIN